VYLRSTSSYGEKNTQQQQQPQEVEKADRAAASHGGTRFRSWLRSEGNRTSNGEFNNNNGHHPSYGLSDTRNENGASSSTYARYGQQPSTSTMNEFSTSSNPVNQAKAMRYEDVYPRSPDNIIGGNMKQTNKQPMLQQGKSPAIAHNNNHPHPHNGHRIKKEYEEAKKRHLPESHSLSPSQKALSFGGGIKIGGASDDAPGGGPYLTSEDVSMEDIGHELAKLACLLRRRQNLQEELLAPLRHEEKVLEEECAELEKKSSGLQERRPTIESAVHLLEVFDKLVQPVQHEILPQNGKNMTREQAVVNDFLKNTSSRRGVYMEKNGQVSTPSWRP